MLTLARRRATLLIPLAGAGLLTLGLGPSPTAYAGERANAQTVSGAKAKVADCTFNDVQGQIALSRAVGIPTTSPGKVDVRDAVHPQTVTGPASTGFGSAVAVAFLNDDHCNDLAVGEPTATGGGAVTLYYGSTTGYSGTADVTLNAQTAADRFGAAVAIGSHGTRSTPYVSDIWVGAPGRTVDGKTGAGAIDHYVMTDTGSSQLAETITEASSVVGGAAQQDAHFGAVLSATTNGVMVGVPDHDFVNRADAGAAFWLGTDADTGHVTTAQEWQQGLDHVAGAPEAGDHFGASVFVSSPATHEWVLVGAPGEDVGTIKDAGLVQSFLLQGGVQRPWSAISQDSKGVPGTAEAGDRFGAAVAAGAGQDCYDGWLIGAPGEDVGSVKDAGAVTSIGSPDSTCAPVGALTQGKSGFYGLGGAAEAGDQVGATLTAMPHLRDTEHDTPFQSATYLIGAPGEDIGTTKDAGLVLARTLIEKSSKRTAQLTSLGYSGGATTDMRYGSVLGLVDTWPKV